MLENTEKSESVENVCWYTLYKQYQIILPIRVRFP